MLIITIMQHPNGRKVSLDFKKLVNTKITKSEQFVFCFCVFYRISEDLSGLT